MPDYRNIFTTKAKNKNIGFKPRICSMCVFQVWSKGRDCLSVKPLAGEKGNTLYFRLCYFCTSTVIIPERVQEWQYLPLEALEGSFIDHF